MRIAIMQPYYVPYISYFDLIHCVDLFVLYDDVQYSKHGWVNRNRVRCPQSASGWKYLTIPVSLPTHRTPICEVRTAGPGDWPARHVGVLRASFGDRAGEHPLVQAIAASPPMPGEPLGVILERLLRVACADLGISTPIQCSRTLRPPAGLKGQDRVIALCKLLGASHYLNLAGGRALYDPAAFQQEGITLEFLPEHSYRGRDGTLNSLSILDLCLADGSEAVRTYLDARRLDRLGRRAA